ncbi:MAG: DUF459 domain-containing protein, partial [Campylobacter sp.]|nr:DUF459 domain-containing protein [Campylobacter sp.]
CLGSGAKAYKFVKNGFKNEIEFTNPNEKICENLLNSLTLPKEQNFMVTDKNLTQISQEIFEYFRQSKEQKAKNQKLARQNKILEENKKKILQLRENAKKIAQNSQKTEQNDTNETANLAANADENLAKPEVKIASIKPKRTGTKISLNSGDGVIFVGDSVMEYVARAAKQIFPKSNLRAFDLSKHSTGLLTKKYHDFNKEIKKTMREVGGVKLVVVLLGANDVWGKRIDGSNREFYSEQWINFYKNNIDEIYETASLGGAQVLWLSLPCMKKKSFDSKIRKLNKIYKEENTKFGGIFMRTDDYICKNGEYISHLNLGNKTIKLRQDDEIHITKAGSMLIAKEILRMINVN